MDPRGPPEGAPAESFEISGIDKAADISVNWPTDHAFASSLCEQPKKLNNRLLFLTVSNSWRNASDNVTILMMFLQWALSVTRWNM